MANLRYINLFIDGDRMETKKNLQGKYVYLKEVEPQFFPYIIAWRNNTDNRRYLNQPFELTLDLQKQWYEEKYLTDDSQGLFVLVDKENDEPFGTMGWTDYDKVGRICVGGRLLVGNLRYRGSLQWREATLLYNRFIYFDLEAMCIYAHVWDQNIASIKWHQKWGFRKSDEIKYKNEIIVNGIIQTEFYRTYDMYVDKLTKML